MQTAIETELINFKNWTLRVCASQNPKRILLLIHGLTGDENSMWVFARDLPNHYWMIAPRAPHTAQPFGYSWRPFLTPEPLPASGLRFGMPKLDELRPSAEALMRLMDEYQIATGIEASEFDVMGFSQGAVMCNILAFLYPQRVCKVGILSGFVPDGLEAFVTGRPLQGKSYFVAHGTQDETVTIDYARSSVKTLEEAGAQVMYCEDAVGHKVSVKCLQALKKFFAE